MQYYMEYDTTTGVPQAFYVDEIHGEKGTEGSLVPDEAIEISEEDWQNYITGDYYYFEGVCTGKPGPSLEEQLIEAINQKLYIMNSDVNRYICSYYDEGTQQSFQAIYTLADSTSEVKVQVLYVWNWIQSVMTHYYMCKNEIKVLTTLEDVENYSYTFKQFDATKPTVTLEAIYSALL